jgi:hypothetical protein
LQVAVLVVVVLAQ